MPKRIALIIANSTSQAIQISRSGTLEADVHELASVLRDPAIGNFAEVWTLADRPSPEIRRYLQDLFTWKKRNDVLLLYIWGHTLLAGGGQLYLATADTEPDSPQDTAIPAAYITACMDRSFSRQKILILDCTCLGAFPEIPASTVGSYADVASIFEGSGYGRVVLCPEAAGQCSPAENEVHRKTEDDRLLPYLIQGLQTGAADEDDDEQIGVGELYEYLNRQAAEHTAGQKIRKWSYLEQDEFIIARSPVKRRQRPSIKWDLLFGAIMTPIATIFIGGFSDLRASTAMAGLFFLFFAALYWALE
jgi:hypothetical protein